jgi:hypothetical protein
MERMAAMSLGGWSGFCKAFAMTALLGVIGASIGVNAISAIAITATQNS